MIEIPQAILTDVVGRMLGGVNVELTRWSVDPIGYSSVSPQIIQAVAQATAALRCVFSTAGWPAAIVRNPDTSARFIHESEQRWGRSIEAIFAQWTSVTAFLLAQAAEARAGLHLSC